MLDGREETQLDMLHRYELEILVFFRELCGVHGLKYFITAGTLLGAVRHKGFIPWDDDIDVVMPRKDFKRLSRIMRKKSYDGFFFQDRKTDKLYPFGFAKLRSERCRVYESTLRNVKMHTGCYIDIFPLDRCPSGSGAAGIFFKLYLFFTIVLLKKADPGYEPGYTKGAVKAALKLLCALPRGMIKAMRQALCACVFGKRLCTVGGAHGYPKETYSAEWFSDSVQMEFEGELFSAPVGWEGLLRNMYGDYMTPPGEDERGGHFMEIQMEAKK